MNLPADAPRPGHVRFDVADGVGRITLTRPQALNAITHDMVLQIADALEAWRTDSEVAVVVLDGDGDRGFSAGGDIRALWEHAAEGDPAAALAFFRDEYRLNAAIAGYAKPIVAIMDGITMGGGIGLGGHASIRVVTERSRLAMPETRIGFVPDVGTTWLMARAPGRTGVHLGLTGAEMDAADAIEAGFADYLVPSDRLPHLLQALAERADPGSPSEIVLLFDETPEQAALAADRTWIDACYSGDTVSGIVEALRRRGRDAGGERAAQAADVLATVSPTALVATLAGIRAAGEAGSLAAALELEYRAAERLVGRPDFREGIRALLIDRDRSPRWDPPTIAEAEAEAQTEADAPTS